MAKTSSSVHRCGPLGKGLPSAGDSHPVFAPMDGGTKVGTVRFADKETARKAVDHALRGFETWSRRPVEERAAALEKLGDLLEENRDRLMAILALEAGKCLHRRHCRDPRGGRLLPLLCAEARAQFGDGRLMPGPTGEENRYRYRGRGVFVCISPWNFPLAIFLGQISAALRPAMRSSQSPPNRRR
jgi:RHH-type proline utilization regulon transcriptional repressor/proline dehydrogenase/delta 1-pyrroline-5-carboxylate dehydrogenase